MAFPKETTGVAGGKGKGIVERLRSGGGCSYGCEGGCRDCPEKVRNEAADLIEEQRAAAAERGGPRA